MVNLFSIDVSRIVFNVKRVPMMTNYRAKATLKVSINFLPSGSCNPESGADRSTWEGLRVGSFYPLDGGWVNNPLGDTEIGSGIAT